MGNVIMKAQQIVYGASNVEAALDDLNVPELIELNKRMDAIDAWKANVHEETYTGSELTINNALALPARSLITEINVIQDLHGLPFPYVGGAYKNKLPMTVERIKEANTSGTWSGNVYSINNGTVTILTDSDNNITGFKANGTFNANTTFYLATNLPLSGEYIISTATALPNGCYMSVRGGATADINPNYTDRSFTANGNCSVTIYIPQSANLTNYVYQPMIRLSTESDASFAPYSNICPISGRTEARVDTENEDSSESAYAVIQLGQTVYGADINWDTGVMTVKTTKGDMGSLTYTAQGRSDDGIGYLYSAFPTGALANGECSSSAFAYTSYVTVAARWEALTTGHLSIIGNGRLMVCGTETAPEAFKTAVTGQDLEYELAEPQTIQLTPTQLQMLKGYNRVTLADGYGEIELKALVLGGDN